MTALRKPVFPDDLAMGSAGSARVGIALAAGALPAFDQQVLRTMLQTLATRLSAYFRISEAREAELTLVDHPGDPASFLLRVRNASNFTEISLPRPLRLMPLADALNASIDIVRPQGVSSPAASAPVGTLAGVLSERVTPAPLRVEGAWGSCVFIPESGEVAFDRSPFAVARALAEDARVTRQEVVKPEVAASLRAAARVRLRRDEVLWLCGPSAEAQRQFAVKLAHPEAFLTLRVWPNLARLPEQQRWLDVFALMQRGAGIADILARAAAEGLGEVQARRGLYLLLQQGHASLDRRAGLADAKVPVAAPPASFLQRLKRRLRQMMEAA
ncbi:MAG: hypothetical protein J0L88_07765 [Xanthomonadales bacterium]|nr:hypothetical protein [Xanthomonadales bacterium]